MVRLPPPLRPLFPYLKPAYVRATGALAPAMQRLSRARGGMLPTGVAATLREAAESSGGRWVQARPAEVIARPDRIPGRPPDLPRTDTGDGESVAAVGVAELPGGRVLGPHRAVVSGRGDLVHEVSWYFGTARPRQHPLYLNPFPPRPLEVSGRVGVLAARGDGNYYHFLMDVVTRLGLLAQAPAITPPERWYVPQQTPFQRELLDLLDIPADSRIDAGVHPHLRAECLVVPQSPAMTEKNPPWTVRFLRERLLPFADAPAARRRIFVTRGPSANNRTVRNETEVLSVLAARGFEAIDPGAMSVLDQISAFASAELIVAPHGAAMTNLVFAPPGAAVVELFPAGCLLPDFWRLACGVPGLSYRYLSAPSGPARATRQHAIVRDIDVDLTALVEVLDELDAGSG
jgi:capsular polysaccharide biosynthesis protein